GFGAALAGSTLDAQYARPIGQGSHRIVFQQGGFPKGQTGNHSNPEETRSGISHEKRVGIQRSHGFIGERSRLYLRSGTRPDQRRNTGGIISKTITAISGGHSAGSRGHAGTNRVESRSPDPSGNQ